MKTLALPLLLLALTVAPADGRAETVQTCTGFISTLPAVISTQGNWCLDHDLATGITAGAAVMVNANNVRIDCNGFKIGNLAAGLSTFAKGVQAGDRLNISIRNCHFRGFHQAVALTGGGGGHLVEDNLFDGVTMYGLVVQGDGSVARNNRLIDTGGSSQSNAGYGIYTTGSVDVLDNLVAGVAPGTCCSAYGNAYGILAVDNAAGQVARNRVSGVVNRESGELFAIAVSGVGRASLRDNHVVTGVPATGTALGCQFNTASASGNYAGGFATGISGCSDDGGNLVKP